MKKLFTIVMAIWCCGIASAREYVNMHSANNVLGEKHLWTKTGQLRSAACTYQSVDTHGAPIELSGRLFIPADGKAERVVLCPHFTITGNSECPSETIPAEAKKLSDKGYAILFPDYIGYGITVAHDHPYLDVQLTVRNCLDMLAASKDFFAYNGVTIENDSIVIIGFSQGAAVAIGLLQEIETRNICPVKKCLVSSGPYDVASLYDVNVERNHVGMGFIVPSLVLGTNVAYDLNLNLETLFTPWLMKHYKDVLSKKYDSVSMFLRMGKGRLDKYLNRTGMDKNNGEGKKLYEGLLRSSLVHIHDGDTVMSDWCPRTPIYLMHSTTDDLVDIVCGENLRTMLEHNGATNVTYDFDDYGGHIPSMMRFLKLLKKEL